MCDTMVALGSATRDGRVLFAKNSDRQPNEPHIMVRIPRLVLAGQVPRLDGYLRERDGLEREWDSLIAENETMNADQMKSIMQTAWAWEDEMVTRVIKENENNPPRWAGTPWFRSYWRRQNTRMLQGR